jgi:hypothetical protein
MFQTPLIVEADPRPGYWILRAPLIWDDGKQTVRVPPGFETDLASIPRMARDVPGFDPMGLSRRPSVLHDWLYAEGFESRMEADRLFYAALRAEGVPEPTARIYYRAVRLFGGAPWARHRRA